MPGWGTVWSRLGRGSRVLLFGFLFLAGTGPIPAASADDSSSRLPAASHVPDIKRLPNGQIVPVESSSEQKPQEQQAQPSAVTPAPSRPKVSTRKLAPATSPASETTRPVAPPVVERAAPESATVTRDIDCPTDAITCVKITGTGGPHDWQPVTFGQPFKKGDVPASATLTARDDKGNPLPLQLDEKVSHPDGSLRFAVLSTELPKLGGGESRVIAIRRGEPSTPLPAAAESGKFDLRIELTLFERQTTVVKFGNRQGNIPGVPFREGENIVLKVGDERFSLTVAPKMSGGALNPYMYIAQAFVPLINGQSRRYRARWNDARDGYEKLWITTVDRGVPFTVTTEYSGPATISVTRYTDDEQPELWTASLDAKAAGKTWLEGPVATERDISLPLVSQTTGKTHPHLSARVHLRHYPLAGAYRADVVLENDWSFVPGPRDFTYDAKIVRDGRVVFRHDDIVHTHHARWHTLVWSEGFAEPRVVPWKIYFLESGAVPHYDPRLAISDRAVERDFQSLSKADTGPLGTALVTLYMPMTGARADIGPLPRWAVLYLLSMDPRERAVLFANADAGAGIPIHYRDKKTDLPVSLDDHPTIVMVFGRPKPADAFPPVAVDDSPWSPQVAHHPSLFYLPYLLTGDLFYLEEQTFWTDWVLASVDPFYRGNAEGLVKPNEIRAQAWSLRTLGETALILPDRHPMKAYFTGKLSNNISWYVAHYPKNHDPEQSPVIGAIPKPDDKGVMAPWQQDFLFISVGQLAEQGVQGADDFLRWMARFTIGRWTSDANGFCHMMAPGYYIKIRNPDMTYARTLRDVFDLNWAGQDCPAQFPFGNPTSPSGYVANAHAALAIGADFGIPGAAEAFNRLRDEAPVMVRAFSDDPTFDITPRR